MERLLLYAEEKISQDYSGSKVRIIAWNYQLFQFQPDCAFQEGNDTPSRPKNHAQKSAPFIP
jgi:hypothetical protein